MPAQIKARVAGPFPAERHPTYPTPLRVTNGENSACRMRRYELIGAPLPDVGCTLAHWVGQPGQPMHVRAVGSMRSASVVLNVPGKSASAA